MLREPQRACRRDTPSQRWDAVFHVKHCVPRAGITADAARAWRGDLLSHGRRLVVPSVAYAQFDICRDARAAARSWPLTSPPPCVLRIYARLHADARDVSRETSLLRVRQTHRRPTPERLPIAQCRFLTEIAATMVACAHTAARCHACRTPPFFASHSVCILSPARQRPIRPRRNPCFT